MPRSIMLLALMLAVLASCADEARAPAAPPSYGYALYSADEIQQQPARGDSGAARPASQPKANRPDRAGLVIRTGQASIRVDSLEPAIALVQALAQRLGGALANTTLQAGDNQVRAATLQVLIPVARFDEAVGGLKPIGKVESVNVTAEDVGEEFVDVGARMENARRLERRLINILSARAGKLSDVLEVEQALARVREEIERYEGRRRYLQAHAAVSSLTVTVHEPAPVVGVAGTSVMGGAFLQAWRNFVALAALVVASLGIVVPLGAVVLVIWFTRKRWRKALA